MEFIATTSPLSKSVEFKRYKRVCPVLIPLLEAGSPEVTVPVWFVSKHFQTQSLKRWPNLATARLKKSTVGAFLPLRQASEYFSPGHGRLLALTVPPRIGHYLPELLLDEPVFPD